MALKNKDSQKRIPNCLILLALQRNKTIFEVNELLADHNLAILNTSKE